MIQDLYQKAITFAGEKHAEQKIPGANSNYILHVSNVAMEIFVAYNHSANFDMNFAIQTAILHDTLEDTNTTFTELENEFGKKIANAVLALTKNEKLTTKTEMMQDSLHRINKLEKEVGIVKIADRITNLQKPPKQWNIEKIRKYYTEAKSIANELKNKNEYLNKRLLLKIEQYQVNNNL